MKKYQVVTTIQKVWDIQGELSVVTTNYRNIVFAFTFSFAKERDSAWHKRIWHVNGSLIVLREWDYNLTNQVIDFNSVTFWVQAHGLHFANMVL